MVDREDVDGEKAEMKAYKAAREDSEEGDELAEVDEVSSALMEKVDGLIQNLEKETTDDADIKIGKGWQILDRDRDGKVTPDDVAAAATYLKNTDSSLFTVTMKDTKKKTTCSKRTVMSGPVLVLLFLTLCIPSVGALTITSPDGDLIDCVNKKDQPAFRNPLLRNHIYQETPTYLPDMIQSQKEYNWQIWHNSPLRCPEGTIPIRIGNPTTTSQAGVEATIGHEYAIAAIENPPPNIYGVKAKMSVWKPKVERDTEFSLGQIWLTAGSYTTKDLNTIEAGWQVYPDLYRDDQPRLFIFWTRDSYNLTKCYNLGCAGFIQTSPRILIGGAISPTSTFEGHLIELTIQIWKDQSRGHWWLGVGVNNGTIFQPVGYWPKELFTRLTDYGDNIKWGGEIVNNNISGRHTSTQMGSGYFPDSAKAAYMWDLEVAASIREFQPVHDITLEATNPTYYSIKKFSNTSFSYGGSEHAGAVRPRLYFLFYSCFSIFLLF